MDKTNKETWAGKMRQKPCYMPAPPFYDFCQNLDRDDVKRLDCTECVEKLGIRDYIE